MSEEQPHWVLVYLSPYELSHFSVGQTNAYYLVKRSLYFVKSLNLDSTLMHGCTSGICPCLESPGDGGAWWAAVYGVAESDMAEVT